MRLEINGEVGVLCVIAEVILFQHRVVEPPGEAALLHMLHLQPNLLSAAAESYQSGYEAAV